MIGSGLGIYASQASGDTSLLLDTYPAVFAVDMRLISSTYSGNWQNVRESDLNTNADIDYDGGGRPDETALLAHTGANNGLTAIWYEQSGNSYDAAQVNAVNQPQIVNAGVVNKVGTIPALSIASSQGLITPTITLGAPTQLWLFFVVDITDNTTNQYLAELSSNYNSNNGSFLLQVSSGNLQVAQKSVTGKPRVDYPISTGYQLITVQLIGGQSTLNGSNVWINGVSQSQSLVASGTTPATYSDYGFNLFARAGSVNSFLNKAQAAYMMTGDQSANQAAIESNINEYYSIF